MTIPQIIVQIRFALSQLGTRNAHHEFEHLCRFLARARICSNILPATGPVSAGGDQGRDFETFKTYLESTELAHSSFLGRVADHALAFACTIQKDDLDNKIRHDVTTIRSAGIPVAGINMFLAEDLNVAKRHKLQEWARQEHNVELMIYDAAAISEMLADPDIFWIAIEFLNLTAEDFPKTELTDDPDWYATLLATCREHNDLPLNYSHFADLKRAIRRATFDESLHPDLPFWLSRLARFEAMEAAAPLRKKACYEISVAMLRGKGHMTGREPNLRAYFSGIASLHFPTDLEDAIVLLSYCSSAIIFGVTTLLETEVSEWRHQVATRIDELLHLDISPSVKCSLLECKGTLSMHHQLANRNTTTTTFDDAFCNWEQLTKEVSGAPLYPLERFVDRITQFTELLPQLADHPAYSILTKQLDQLLSQRVGEFAVAEKCRDRAIAFHKNGQIIRAIEELHRVKSSFFTDETLYGCALSILLLAQWYNELGLTYAGRYHGMASAAMANASSDKLKRFMPRGLIVAADCAYSQGDWFDFLAFANTAVQATSIVPTTGRGIGSEKEFQRLLFNTTMVQLMAERLDTHIAEVVRTKLVSWGLAPTLDILMPDALRAWSNTNDEELWSRLHELSGPPFQDVGEIREVRWRQLGIAWKVQWSNRASISPKAQQLIALLQILLCAVADKELCLQETAVEIQISVGVVPEPDIRNLPSNQTRRWMIVLPGGILLDNPNQHANPSIEALSIATILLMDVSLLPEQSFLKMFEQLHRDGLPHKTYIVKSYESLYREFIAEDAYYEDERRKLRPPGTGRVFQLKEHQELSIRMVPGPGYSRAEAEQAIKNRYSRAIIPIGVTLSRLRNDAEFQRTVEKLRKEGWRDWHLLMAICNVVINFRIQKRMGTSRDIELFKRISNEVMSSPESASDEPVPISLFSEKGLRTHLNMSMQSTLHGWGLMCRQKTPDLKAIERFLAKRYNYWVDDLPHNDPFAAITST